MPQIPDTAPAFTGLSASFVDGGGQTASASLRLDGAGVPASYEAWFDAIGDASNAAQFKTVASATAEILKSDPALTPFDEAYASVSNKLVFAFQNTTTREIRYLEVPAPDASLFLADGVTADLAGNTTVQAIITTSIEQLGAGWVLARAFRSDRTRRYPRPNVAPEYVEPAALELPPPAPDDGA